MNNANLLDSTNIQEEMLYKHGAKHVEILFKYFQQGLLCAIK